MAELERVMLQAKLLSADDEQDAHVDRRMGIVEAYRQEPPLAIEDDSQVAGHALVALLAHRPRAQPRVPVAQNPLSPRDDVYGNMPG